MNKITRTILKIIGQVNLTQYLIEQSQPAESKADEKTWSEAYWRVPLLKEWLKKRELAILKGLPLSDKPTDFARGQLFENLLYQHYDTPRSDLEQTKLKVEVEEPKLDKESILQRWNQDAKKETESPRSAGDEGQKGQRSQENRDINNQ